MFCALGTLFFLSLTPVESAELMKQSQSETFDEEFVLDAEIDFIDEIVLDESLGDECEFLDLELE